VEYFEVKNFDSFQHYKDRTPPWIKLYNSILEDYEFACLQDASKLQLVLIWLLASRTNNKIPYDERWIQKKLQLDSEIDLDTLERAGFINKINGDSSALADCLQNARPEERRGEERESMSEQKIVPSIPLKNGDEWSPTDELMSEWQSAYPLVDLSTELAKARAWNKSNKSKRKTKSGIAKHLNLWLSRAQKDMESNPKLQPAKIDLISGESY